MALEYSLVTTRELQKKGKDGRKGQDGEILNRNRADVASIWKTRPHHRERNINYYLYN